jgi:hypothetical protein
VQTSHALDDRGGIRLAAVYAGTAHHGTAVDQDRGQVQTGCRHEHAGDDFIAGPQQHQPVVLVGLHHQFDAVCDDVTGGQNVTHALVALGNTVAGADDPELHRGAAGRTDAFPDRRGDLAEVGVAGDSGAPGVGDTDQGFFEILIGVAHGFIVGPVDTPLRPLQDFLTAQFHMGFFPSIGFRCPDSERRPYRESMAASLMASTMDWGLARPSPALSKAVP